ncbi:MAG: dicarboxylate/amino acid:cation symporter [Gorillibacterium sp.]|nr:dicarboxylate/amino acid:cation symporter [Gorillibacterium sp.]
MVTILEYRWPHIWSLLAAFSVLGILYALARLKLGFNLRVLFAMVVGMLLGTLFGRYALEVNIGIFGQIYVNLVKMLVIPLVLSTIISGMITLQDHFKAIRKIVLQALILFLGTTAAAALVGMLVAIVIDPGAGIVQNDSSEGSNIPTLTKVILDLIPTNPIVELAAGRLMPIIVLAILIVIAAARETAQKPKEKASFKAFFDVLAKIILRLTKLIVSLTPYGVFGLAAAMGAKYGVYAFKPLGGYILTIYIACLLQVVIVLAGIVLWSVGINPLRLLGKLLPVMIVAFTTRSSYATLPIQLLTLIKRVRIAPRIASLMTSLGTAINLNGCCGIYPAVVAIFVAKVYGVQLGMAQYIQIVIVAAVISLVIAGVSRPASISATIMLTVLGLPTEGLALIIGVEFIVDMALTTVNVAGTAISTLIVANAQGEFDRGRYLADRLDWDEE